MDIQIKFIAPNTSISLSEESNADVLCLDMDESNFDSVLNWVQNYSRNLQHNSCIVVVGSHSDKEQRQKVINAGAIFYRKPEECSSHEALRHCLKEKLENLYPNINGSKAGYVFARQDAIDNELSQTPSSNQLNYMDNHQNDISIYYDPPFQASDEDFKKLLQRLGMPDDSFEKDD